MSGHRHTDTNGNIRTRNTRAESKHIYRNHMNSKP